ncbi:MAG: hypothetical protein KDA88_17540 [Planctomycetaceae bacterium]|nr:hypothetical protein [Planctomycetaceae bacterium]MCB9952419.1 hypothetical protein [Planctomycetaceae bacterium]
MKIGCNCGATIFDSADYLPQKGHLIPDQDWFDVYDAIDDDVIDKVADGTLTKEAAYMKAREIIGSKARLMWQCVGCGSLYVDGRDGQLHGFVPATEETDRRVLAGRSK